MKLTLIKPNIGIRAYSGQADNASMEPLQLGVLAGLTPSDIDVVLYDDRLEAIPYDEQTDLAAITVETFTARRSYEIAAEFRARGVKVLLGGMHVTLCPAEAAEHADAIMVGDAEDQWGTMLDDLHHGALKARYDCAPVAVPQAGIFPRREIYAGKKYLPMTLLQYSRGCKNHCHYCASSVYFRQCHYTRPVAEVVAEIKSQCRKLLFFVDDNIVADREKAKDLFRALIPLKIKWVSQGSMDMLEDDALMSLLVRSGCLGLVIGFESVLPASIAAMGKGVNTGGVADQYAKTVEELRRWGLQTWAAFTVGHDNDTLESIEATWRFAQKSKFCFAAYNILMPYPGTELYRQLEREGRLLYGGKWWLDPGYRFNYAAYTPKHMTAEELTAASFRCRSEFNRPRSILYRALEPHTNLRNPMRLLTYLVYNPVFRREVFEKQGMTFGYGEGEV